MATVSPNFLVVMNKSTASKRAVRYVAGIVGGRRGFRVCLAYVLPSLPPALLEFGGSEHPEEEARQSARLKTEQRRWMAAARRSAERQLDQARGVLRQAGLPAGAIGTQVVDPADGRDIAEEILAVARSCTCRTVVLGRESLSGLREPGGGDLTEEIVRRGKGLAVWVVE